MKVEHRVLIAWGWAVELIFAAVLTGFIFLIWDMRTIEAFLRETASDWITVTGQVLFPASVALWITYVNLEASQFGDYLRSRGADRMFTIGFVLPIVIFLGSTVLLIGFKGSRQLILVLPSIFFLSYSLALTLALISNGTAVVRLYRAFKLALEKEEGGNKTLGQKERSK